MDTNEYNSQLYIEELLNTNNRAVERAMVVLYNRQTADEKCTNQALYRNGRGFSSADARQGTYYAKWVLSGKKLSGRFLDQARCMAFKYVKQLVEEANIKMQKEQEYLNEERLAIKLEIKDGK